jgi:hypothetical protein
LGSKLPPSAYKYIAWWYNKNYIRPWSMAEFKPEKVNLKEQSLTFRYRGNFSEEARNRIRARDISQAEGELEQAEAQLEAAPTGFECVRAAIVEGRANVQKKRANMLLPPGLAEDFKPYRPPNEPAGAQQRCRHPIYGALKGHIRLVAGTDLTEPADPDWGNRAWPDDSK